MAKLSLTLQLHVMLIKHNNKLVTVATALSSLILMPQFFPRITLAIGFQGVLHGIDPQYVGNSSIRAQKLSSVVKHMQPGELLLDS